MSVPAKPQPGGASCLATLCCVHVEPKETIARRALIETSPGPPSPLSRCCHLSCDETRTTNGLGDVPALKGLAGLTMQVGDVPTARRRVEIDTRLRRRRRVAVAGPTHRRRGPEASPSRDRGVARRVVPAGQQHADAEVGGLRSRETRPPRCAVPIPGSRRLQASAQVLWTRTSGPAVCFGAVASQQSTWLVKAPESACGACLRSCSQNFARSCDFGYRFVFSEDLRRADIRVMVNCCCFVPCCPARAAASESPAGRPVCASRRRPRGRRGDAGAPTWIVHKAVAEAPTRIVHGAVAATPGPHADRGPVAGPPIRIVRGPVAGAPPTRIVRRRWFTFPSACVNFEMVQADGTQDGSHWYRNSAFCGGPLSRSYELKQVFHEDGAPGPFHDAFLERGHAAYLMTR